MTRTKLERFRAQKEKYLRDYSHIPLEDFAGGRGTGESKYSYPCNTPRHCVAALARAHFAPHPAKIRANVYKIAKRKGFINPETGKIKLK